MSLTNDSNISLEIHQKPNILYDEVDIMTSNRRIIKSTESPSLEVTRKDSSPKKFDISTDLIFGVSINILKPRKIGSVKAFFYVNNFPLIILGPDCKYYN